MLLLLLARLIIHQVELFRGFGRRSAYRFYCQWVGFQGQSKTWWVLWGEWPQSWQWLRAVWSILFMYWPRIRQWPVRNCASIVLVFICCVCSVVAIGGDWSLVVLMSCYQWQFWPHHGGCCWLPTCSWCSWVAHRRGIAGC